MTAALWDACPVCGAEDDCGPDCYLGARRNVLIHCAVRVHTDAEGEDFIHGTDMLNLLKAYIDVLEVTSGIGNPLSEIHVDGIRRGGWFICAALDPEQGIRTTDVLDTDVPDTIPAEWLASGGSND